MQENIFTQVVFTRTFKKNKFLRQITYLYICKQKISSVYKKTIFSKIRWKKYMFVQSALSLSNRRVPAADPLELHTLPAEQELQGAEHNRGGGDGSSQSRWSACSSLRCSSQCWSAPGYGGEEQKLVYIALAASIIVTFVLDCPALYCILLYELDCPLLSQGKCSTDLPCIMLYILDWPAESECLACWL